MTSLAWLIPIALFLGALGLGGFIWALKSGQYEDLDGAAWRGARRRSAGKAAGGSLSGKGVPIAA